MAGRISIDSRVHENVSNVNCVVCFSCVDNETNLIDELVDKIEKRSSDCQHSPGGGLVASSMIVSGCDDVHFLIQDIELNRNSDDISEKTSTLVRSLISFPSRR